MHLFHRWHLVKVPDGYGSVEQAKKVARGYICPTCGKRKVKIKPWANDAIIAEMNSWRKETVWLDGGKSNGKH